MNGWTTRSIVVWRQGRVHDASLGLACARANSRACIRRDGPLNIEDARDSATSDDSTQGVSKRLREQRARQHHNPKSGAQQYARYRWYRLMVKCAKSLPRSLKRELEQE